VADGLTKDVFLRNLNESNLLPPEELERAVASLGAGGDPALALAAAGVLTAYQANAVRQRRFADLRIGNYDLLDRLGAGGMGTVFKARHRRMKRIVALKVLARQLSRDQTFVQRFQREVETIARMSHPNIVMAYDADQAEAGHFLVMEYVSGHDLATVVNRQGSLAPPESAQLPDAGGTWTRVRPRSGHHPPRHQTRQSPPR
jgi:hypothetical protein